MHSKFRRDSEERKRCGVGAKSTNSKALSQEQDDHHDGCCGRGSRHVPLLMQVKVRRSCSIGAGLRVQPLRTANGVSFPWRIRSDRNARSLSLQLMYCG